MVREWQEQDNVQMNTGDKHFITEDILRLVRQAIDVLPYDRNNSI